MLWVGAHNNTNFGGFGADHRLEWKNGGMSMEIMQVEGSTAYALLTNIGGEFEPGDRILFDMSHHDVHGSGIITGQVESAARWRILLQKMQQEGVPFSAGALNCSGADIMNWLSLPASPAVGKIKAALLAHCAVYPADNTPARLKKLACDMLHRDAQDETRL